MAKEERKMTLEEYQDKYNKPQNIKAAKSFLFIFAAAIGVIVFLCIFLIVLKLYDINKYAGYAGTAVGVLIYVLVYIVPLIKIYKTKAFITVVDASNALEAKRYNKKLREDIADKMIDVTSHTKDVTWYSEKSIADLAIARYNKDDKATKVALTNIYDNDVRQASNKMIRDHALKVGMTTALSQSEKLDTLFVCAYDLSLIKDIIFLYGFRPSDAKLVKIYKTVLTNALIAYGLSNVTGSMATGVVKKLSKSVESVPLLGSVIGTVVDSVTQGVVNSTLTIMIGFQTRKYLKEEYHLQDILDEIDLSDELEAQEEQSLMSSVSDEIKATSKNKKYEPAKA